jgi:hypothetical protein
MQKQIEQKSAEVQAGQVYTDKRFEAIVKVEKVEAGRVYFAQVIGFDEARLRKEYGSEATEQFLQRYQLLEKPLDELVALGEKIISGEIPYTFENVGAEFEGESAMVSADAKTGLLAKVAGLEQVSAQMESMRQCFSFAMNKKKAELEAINQAMKAQLELVYKTMRRIVKVIESIELYLGINEEMVQFQAGEFAEEGEPIVFRQLVLFMDEEVAETSGGGLDVNDLDKFEEWLRNPENLQLVLPEKKGMVAFKPRRYRKEYGNPMTDAQMQQVNAMTFFLIRNGDNLTRIFTNNLQVSKTMFPGSSGMAELQKRAEKAWAEREKEEIKDELQDHARLAMFFQGLIDRSDVFKPHAQGINIFTDGAEGSVVFLYDAEALLPDGRKPFRQWQAEINEKLVRGSRVVIAGAEGFKDMWPNRFARYYNSQYIAPSKPEDGVYNLEEKEGKFIFFYLPKSHGWKEHVTRQVSYMVQPSDSFVLNYDQISLEDVEFYLKNRVERPNYLKMMPVLRTIRKERLEETRVELEFARAMAHTCKVPEETVLQAVQWWKMKVISKRPLGADDAKAWRMIKAKIQREK